MILGASVKLRSANSSTFLDKRRHQHANQLAFASLKSVCTNSAVTSLFDSMDCYPSLGGSLLDE